MLFLLQRPKIVNNRNEYLMTSTTEEIICHFLSDLHFLKVKKNGKKYTKKSKCRLQSQYVSLRRKNKINI